LKQTLRGAILLSLACAALAALSNFALAQKIDLAFGVSTVDAPAPGVKNGVDVPSLTGGTYPGFSGDVLFWHNLGIGGEIYWKANQGKYNGDPTLPFRPIYLDFDAVYAPKLASHTYLELDAGIGAIDTRIYCQGCGNGYNTNYSSDKHFMGDFGAGIKFYPKGGFFVRPEAKLYLVNNNLNFSSARITRFGLSIGYTFGGH
jgi:Outer membrane protein beta-barrel domain